MALSQASMARAIARAQALRLFERVDGDGRRFLVDSTSRPGRHHLVTVAGSEYRCSCEAGSQDRACVHAAACFIVRNGLQNYRISLRAQQSPARPSDAQQRDALREAIRRPLPADDGDGPSLSQLLNQRPRQSAAA